MHVVTEGNEPFGLGGKDSTRMLEESEVDAISGGGVIGFFTAVSSVLKNRDEASAAVIQKI